MRAVPFTQYLRPNGRPRAMVIDRPEPVAEKAQALLRDGCRLDIEELSTGEISLTVEDEKGETIASELCANGPAVEDAVDRLIERAMKLLHG